MAVFRHGGDHRTGRWADSGGYMSTTTVGPWIFFINVFQWAFWALTMVSNSCESRRTFAPPSGGHGDQSPGQSGLVASPCSASDWRPWQYVLEEGNRDDWSTLSHFRPNLVSSRRWPAFIVREMTAVAPAVDIALFKDSVFTAGQWWRGDVRAAHVGDVLVAVFLQEVLGYTATQSGLALMPRALIMMVVTPIVGRTYNVLSPRLVVSFGVTCVAVSTWMMSHYTLATSERGIVVALLVQGWDSVACSCLGHHGAQPDSSPQAGRRGGIELGGAFHRRLDRAGDLCHSAHAPHDDGSISARHPCRRRVADAADAPLRRTANVRADGHERLRRPMPAPCAWWPGRWRSSRR